MLPHVPPLYSGQESLRVLDFFFFFQRIPDLGRLTQATFHDQEPSVEPCSLTIRECLVKVHAALSCLQASAAWCFADTKSAVYLAAETPERQQECAHLKFTVVRFSNVTV